MCSSIQKEVQAAEADGKAEGGKSSHRGGRGGKQGAGETRDPKRADGGTEHPAAPTRGRGGRKGQGRADPVDDPSQPAQPVKELTPEVR